MTKLLEEAFEAASKLPAGEQDDLARALLEQLESEKQWEKATPGTPDDLKALADEARNEHRAGRTKDLDPDAL